ncbi:MAG: CaiB/BaiF CoA-transferase family protein [Candidatus Bathyarchaeota archaeon]|nr:CaiB/BaiF CoA-transferase family protein [Candidatus Bathyarchaeota archaeon]
MNNLMRKPLEDIRVVDMTHVWFGPWATMMLADMGAEVIRIEPPWGAIDRISEGMLYGRAPYTFHHLNQNKKDLTLNLKSPEGMRLLKELIKKSDIVVQNMSVGTMEKLGLGYEDLKKLNPGIIYAALSGFGQTGPYKNRNCYAMFAEAMSGHTRMTGDGVDPEGPPIEMAMALGDMLPGSMAAMAILAALRYRDKTGLGQMIDVAQLDCMVAVNPGVTGYFLSGMPMWEMRKKYPTGGVGGIFKAKDGGWVRVGAFSPSALENLKKFLNMEEPTKEDCERYVASKNRDEAVAELVAADLPSSPIYQLDETVKDPHLAARGMFIEVDHPLAGKYKTVNNPIKFSLTPTERKTPAPTLGQHNKEILSMVLGLSDAQIDELINNGVVAPT